MEPYTLNVIFKIFLVIAGIFCIYLGYRLFIKGISNDAGEIEAKVKNYSLLIKRAAPGTFLFILGTIIIIVGITRVFQVYTKTQPSEKDAIPDKREVFDPRERQDVEDNKVGNSRNRQNENTDKDNGQEIIIISDTTEIDFN